VNEEKGLAASDGGKSGSEKCAVGVKRTCQFRVEQWCPASGPIVPASCFPIVVWVDWPAKPSPPGSMIACRGDVFYLNSELNEAEGLTVTSAFPGFRPAVCEHMGHLIE
jgi:hypothetical protein